MAMWWSAPKTEKELLERLYDLTNGTFYAADPDGLSSPTYAPWGGYEEAQRRAEKPTYLRKYRFDISFRIGKFGLLPIPGAQLVTSPVRLKFNFGAMAGAAWAYGYRKGAGPKNLEEAQHDLLAITTVWAQRHQALNWTEVAGMPMQGTDSIAGFGKRFLYVLARNGSLKIGKRTSGSTMGPLSAIAFSDEILPAVGEELFRLFKDELFDGAVDEFIPGVASVTSVVRAWKRLDTFHELAQKYYDFKAARLA